MRRLLVAAALIGTSFPAVSPAEAKSIWLKCGRLEINLDSAKERFLLTDGGKIYQGIAMFSPGQINFEYQWLVSGDGGLKHAYIINRKSLQYSMLSLSREVRGGSDSGWYVQKREDGSPIGTDGICLIMKTPPTTGNKI